MRTPDNAQEVFGATEPVFENQSQLARDQANVVNNCWSEGSYELGVEALNAFRTVDKRYPSPSHIRHLLALALYPPARPHIAQPSARPSTPPPKSAARSRSRPGGGALSPRKLQAQTEIPSSDASQLALKLLTTLASTTHPTHLTTGLSSYVRPACDASEFDSMLSSGKVDGFKSPLIVEAVKVGQARDCWQMVREGFLERKEPGGPSTAQLKREADDDDNDDDIPLGDAGYPSVVASHAWGVVEWWISLFEVDERVSSGAQGSATPSDIFLSHIPQASRAGAPQWDVQAVLDVVYAAHRHIALPASKLPRLGTRLLRLLINASMTLAVPPGILVRAMVDRLQTLSSSVFVRIFELLYEVEHPDTEFPTELYTRFSFCLAALYLARAGVGVSEDSVFGAADSLRRGPKARPTARTVESQSQSQAETPRGAGSYPYPAPALQTSLALLRSTPDASDSVSEAFCMHAVARWAILRSLVVEMACPPAEVWMSVNDLPEWRNGVIESVRTGFDTDTSGGAEILDGTKLWRQLKEQCELLYECL